MEIKAIRMFDGGFMNQQFAFGGEGKEGTDEQIIYRSSLQNFLIDTGNEVILVDTGFQNEFKAPEKKLGAPLYMGEKVKDYTEAFAELWKMQPGEPSATIRERVISARKIQEERYKSFAGIHCNAQMTEKMLHEFAEPDAQSLDMLRMAMERLKLSARAYSRILKVARTIADLAGSEQVQSMHIAEAIGYRKLDRGDWADRGI